MKRTFQKILGLSLLTLASCSGPSQKVVAYDDEGYPLLTTGTLHDVSVRYGNREFTKDGSTEYQVIYDSNFLSRFDRIFVHLNRRCTIFQIILL